MSYSPNAMQMDHHMFDNVFVNPESYAAFLETGTWPDKTVLGARRPHGAGQRIDQSEGQFSEHRSDGDRGAREGRSAFSGEVGFLCLRRRQDCQDGPHDYRSATAATPNHAAVDTTFVQFYPTLLPIARSKGTLSAAYQKESTASAQK